MKKIKNMMLPIFLLVVITTPVRTGALVTPVNVQPGDSFVFEITALENSQKVNGTEYTDLSTADVTVGDKVKMEVTNVQDAETDALFTTEEQTIVNATQTINDKTEDVFSVVDEWADIYIFGLLFVAFSGFGFPEFATFEQPEIDSSEDNFADEAVIGLPVFATSNSSFYQEFIDTSDFSNMTESKGSNSTTVEIMTKIDTKKDLFTFDLLYSVIEVGSYLGEATYFEVLFKYIIDVDFACSVVTFFHWEIIMDFQIGVASAFTNLLIEFTEEGSSRGNNDDGGLLDSVPFTSLPLIVFTTLFIAIFTRKIQK